MNAPSRTWLYISVGLLLCLVLINSVVGYRNIAHLKETSDLVGQTYGVLDSLERLVSTMKDVETGQRGYLLTSKPEYLEPYTSATVQANLRLKRVTSLVSDNPRQRERVRRLAKLVADKLDASASSIKLHDQGDTDVARSAVLAGDQKRIMDDLRALVDEMEREESILLLPRVERDHQAYRSALTSVAVAAAVDLGALAAFLWLLYVYLTSLRRSAAAVHQQRQLLQATLGSIGDGVIATDAEGRVTFLNDVAAKLTGWAQADAVGEPLAKVFHVVHEETRAELDNPARKAIAEGRIVGLANHTLLIGRDGTEWPIDDSAAPISGEGGKVTGAVLVFREIRQRRRQEQELQRHAADLQAANQRMNALLGELAASEHQFHTMADSIPQLAWMTRPDGYIYWYNQRWYEYTGTQSSQMEGWGWQSVHDPQELPRVLDNWSAALAVGEPWEDTFPLRRHDGAMRWHLSRAVPVRNDRQEITGWFGTNTDITERLEMEEALRAADRRKDEFLATLAHELRNPISPISNALQLWPLVQNDRNEMERLRAIMERQVCQITRLVDDLLDVSRIARGKLELRTERVDISNIVSAAIESVRPLIDGCGHQLRVDVTTPLVVEADSARLTQVLGNLLQNAAKYTGRDGIISISASREDRTAVLSVADNGPGIAREMLDRIFEVFQQVDQTLDRSSGGLGLGLTLVKRLVELHHGTVEARSPGKGNGSEFIVRLPLVDAKLPAPAAQQSESPASVAELASRRILVVDDVRASAKTLAMMLESLGQEVAIAHDGSTAIDYVATHRPEVVFLDIAMPDMDGYEVARRLRGEPFTVTLVALTGYGNPEDTRCALEAGFDYHLTKPTSISELNQLLLALSKTPHQSDQPTVSRE